MSHTTSHLARALIALLIGLTPVACGDDSDDPTPGGQVELDAGDTSAPDTDEVIDTGESGETGPPPDADDPSDATDDTALSDTSPEDAAPDAEPDVAPDTTVEPPPDPEGQEVAFTESVEYAARRAELLEFCAANNGPGQGGIYGQTCVVAASDEASAEYNDAAIDEAIERLETRRDTADFRANALVRLLYLDNATGALGDARRGRIEQTLLDFKYWIDEPGEDGMAYWTENHQILFHTAELLAGQRWPDTAFSNSGMTGAEHVAHAAPRIMRWLDLRGRYGFSEWHSNVYFNEDIPALVNLVDFAEDPEIRVKAAMVLDIIALDLLHNTHKGVLVTSHGRTYPSKWIGGLNDSTREAAWLMLGLGEYQSSNNFGGSFLATSSYFTPPLIEQLALRLRDRNEHRQRDSFDVAKGPADANVQHTADLDEVVVWAGLSAIAHPDAIDGSMQIMDEYDLWDNFLFGDFPDDVLSLLQSLIGTPQLRVLAEELRPISVGIAFEEVNTYAYRTPHYQLGGAQDYKPGLWGAQTIMWTAALDDQAFVRTLAPGPLGIDFDDVNVDALWNGGWYPRVTLHENVGVIQYRALPDIVPFVYEYLAYEFTHAYVPRDAFDEVIDQDGWIIARKGDAFLALWSQHPMVQADDPSYQMRVEGTDNVYLIELGSADEHDSFEAFTQAILAATAEVTADGLVRFDSPSQGLVEVAWDGPMQVAGAEADLGPYDRWENPHTHQRYGDDWLDVTLDGQLLRLDFISGARRLFTLD